jgi:hypothetical protein
MSTFLATYWPWIMTALIPTLITGLSLSPKTAPEAAWLQKAWDYLKKFMNVFSVATHKDESGTFKLPLHLGKLLKKKMVPPAVLIILGIGVHHGCATMSAGLKKAGSIAADCTIQAVKDQEKDLVPVLAAAAEGTSLATIATSLAGAFTEDAMACAAKDAKTLLASKLAAGAAPGSSATNVNKLAKLIADRKWTYKE